MSVYQPSYYLPSFSPPPVTPAHAAPQPPYFIPPPPPHMLPPPPHVLPPPVPVPPHPSIVIMVVFISLGGLLFGLMCVALCCCLIKKKKKAQEPEVFNFHEHVKIEEAVIHGEHGGEICVVSIEEDVSVQEKWKEFEKVGEESNAKHGETSSHAPGITEPRISGIDKV